jgi:hypothetical protein
MKTFDFKPTLVSHTLKTRILNLWNPTASPLSRSITTQSLLGEGKPACSALDRNRGPLAGGGKIRNIFGQYLLIDFFQ